MPTVTILPLSVFMALMAYAFIANTYVMPRLHAVSRANALVPLLLPHCFRYIGLAFLIPGVTTLPLDARFSNPAAYGDLIAALLAFLAIFALRQGWRSAIFLVWVFNVAGTLDLLNAVYKGLSYTESGNMGATYFIPTVVVPALLVLHAMIFRILMRSMSAEHRA